jgi:hypothetical protein
MESGGSRLKALVHDVGRSQVNDHVGRGAWNTRARKTHESVWKTWKTREIESVRHKGVTWEGVRATWETE